MRTQPKQGQPRCRMRSRTECETGIEREIERIGFRRRTPGGHYPESVVDANGTELTLRRAHPVLLGHGECDMRRRRLHETRGRVLQRCVGIMRGIEQRRELGNRP